MGRQKRPTTLESIRDLTQVAAALEASTTAKDIFSRPEKGWLRSVRQLYGLNLSEIASRRNIAPQVLLRAEVAELQDRITIKNLRAIADAMGFDLFYCLVPRGDSARAALKARISEVVLQGALDTAKDDMERALIMDALDRKPAKRRLKKLP
jgi:hypothetical protein